MEIQRQVGENVRKARLAAGLSQWQLVARLEELVPDGGIDQAYISHLENGRKNPTLLSLWYISQALNMKIEALMRETPT
jgi:transcriptional regulator with XRE-family HTH domain